MPVALQQVAYGAVVRMERARQVLPLTIGIAVAGCGVSALAVGDERPATVVSDSSLQADGQPSSRNAVGDEAREDARDDLHARERLAAAFDALRELDYRGELVHLRGQDLTALSIVHKGMSSTPDAASRDAYGIGRLGTLSGKPREVFRDRSNRSLAREIAVSRQLLPLGGEIDADPENYRVVAVGNDRVAARLSDVIDVMPRDGLRHGYRYWIDHENDMLLRVMVIDDTVTPVEQMMFVDISFPEEMTESEIIPEGLRRPVPPAVPHNGADSRMVPGNRMDSRTMPGSGVDSHGLVGRTAPAKSPDMPGRVRFEWLPAGFERYYGRRVSVSPDGRPLAQVVVSDGVADVSVYVEVAETASDFDGIRPGLSRMGAMSAWREQRDELLITVVGAVPPHTAQRIAAATRFD
ncbi:MAG: hypothetical protein CSA54_04515 [Gammaproteobacteria bacterium]|nr:MAG: hypothetical protein CSA54_04515 [Gammaproteobacteria bacterium]